MTGLWRGEINEIFVKKPIKRLMICRRLLLQQ